MTTPVEHAQRVVTALKKVTDKPLPMIGENQYTAYQKLADAVEEVVEELLRLRKRWADETIHTVQVQE